MSRRQAGDYLNQFLSEMPASRERFAAALERHGASPHLAEDTSPSSLLPVWEALSPSLAWQDDYRPDPPTRADILRWIEELGDLDALPSWLFEDSAAISLSPDTIWLVDGLGRHLGNVLSAQVPNMRWAVGRHRNRNYVYQNHPIITTDPGTGQDHHPLESTAIIIRRHLRGEGDSLPALHANWLGMNTNSA